MLMSMMRQKLTHHGVGEPSSSISPRRLLPKLRIECTEAARVCCCNTIPDQASAALVSTSPGKEVGLNSMPGEMKKTYSLIVERAEEKKADGTDQAGST